MPATTVDPRASVTDEEVLLSLAGALSDTLDMISVRLWADDDPPSRASVEAAASLAAKARALVRTFEEGPQDARKDESLCLFAPDDDLESPSDGDRWLIGAREWQRDLETHAAMLSIEGRDA